MVDVFSPRNDSVKVSVVLSDWQMRSWTSTTDASVDANVLTLWFVIGIDVLRCSCVVGACVKV
jgi:hypothetical protein